MTCINDVTNIRNKWLQKTLAVIEQTLISFVPCIFGWLTDEEIFEDSYQKLIDRYPTKKRLQVILQFVFLYLIIMTC